MFLCWWFVLCVFTIIFLYDMREFQFSLLQYPIILCVSWCKQNNVNTAKVVLQNIIVSFLFNEKKYGKFIFSFILLFSNHICLKLSKKLPRGRVKLLCNPISHFRWYCWNSYLPQRIMIYFSKENAESIYLCIYGN